MRARLCVGVLPVFGLALGRIFLPAGESLLSSRDGDSGRVHAALEKLKADEARHSTVNTRVNIVPFKCSTPETHTNTKRPPGGGS